MRAFLQHHNGAADVLPDSERTELIHAIESCGIEPARSAASRIRSHIERSLGSTGWSGEVQVEPPSQITISSIKNRVGLCVQTGGNMSRMYADILKLQKLYLDNVISVGTLILPTSPAARALGDNVANADRLKAELPIFRKVIHLPLVLIAFE
jgi:hypothetical protein